MTRHCLHPPLAVDIAAEDEQFEFEKASRRTTAELAGLRVCHDRAGQSDRLLANVVGEFTRPDVSAVRECSTLDPRTTGLAHLPAHEVRQRSFCGKVGTCGGAFAAVPPLVNEFVGIWQVRIGMASPVTDGTEFHPSSTASSRPWTLYG